MWCRLLLLVGIHHAVVDMIQDPRSSLQPTGLLAVSSTNEICRAGLRTNPSSNQWLSPKYIGRADISVSSTCASNVCGTRRQQQQQLYFHVIFQTFMSRTYIQTSCSPSFSCKHFLWCGLQQPPLPDTHNLTEKYFTRTTLVCLVTSAFMAQLACPCLSPFSFGSEGAVMLPPRFKICGGITRFHAARSPHAH